MTEKTMAFGAVRPCGVRARVVRRMLAVLAALVVPVLGLGACSSQEGPDPRKAVFLVTTATANEPAQMLVKEAEEVLLTSAGVREARAVVLLPQEGQIDQVGTADLAVMRGQDIEQDRTRRQSGFAPTLDALNQMLTSAQSSARDLDLLTGLDAAARKAPASTIVALSSGLQTRGLADFAGLGWDFSLPEVLDRLADAGFQPDLTGKDMIFVGVGDVTGAQEPLPAPMRTTLEDFWRGVCERGHATSCRFVSGAGGSTPAADTTGVKTVPVPRFELQPRPAVNGQVSWSLDSSALFAPDSAVLLPEAQKVIAQAARQLTASASSVEIVGHTARFGSPEGARQLSLERARAVAEELVRNGVSNSKLVSVRGVGFDEPVTPAPGQDEAAANRSVVLTVVSN
ncbi:OmpA family protein [Dietzia sp. DQ12-45-1b]|uniref:OmpA family protein n=1 Tax=Dietzia sp. DQ12-45-1b TaxID=912801 RepID=UPI000D2087C1|nr:OmpA family protein [Dietzia sp. DQ12-45-1b]AVZ38464.1 hypothetical protein CT688_02145 [Dietzia sp. JS16-p6b]